MNREPKTCLLLVAVAAGIFACANKADNSSPTAWDCSTSLVPNGEATSCVTTGLALADGPLQCGISTETLCPPTGTGGATGVGGSPATDVGVGGTPATDVGVGGNAGIPPNNNWYCESVDGVVTCTQTNCVPDSVPLKCGACVPTPVSSLYEDCVPPQEGGCWITGGGFVVDADGNDSFGGNGMPMKDGTIRGEWEHVDHGTGNKVHGQVNYLVCRHVDEPGPGQPSGPSKKFDINQAYFGGPARWFTNGAWSDGYWFDIMAEDHGEPGNKPGPGKHGSAGPDYYHLTVMQMQGANQSGVVVYDVLGTFEGGNFQIHPSNTGHPSTAGTLPSWVQLQP